MKQHWTRRLRAVNDDLRQANARLTALPDTRPPIFATFLLGTHNPDAGHGCLHFREHTISGTYTVAEILRRANRAPVFDITHVDVRLWRILDLPIDERTSALRAIFCPELDLAAAGTRLPCVHAQENSQLPRLCCINQGDIRSGYAATGNA